MKAWQFRLTQLTRHGNRLPAEWRETFHSYPPSGDPQAEGLPSCPSIVLFDSICDGCSFGAYTLYAASDRADIMDDARRLLSKSIDFSSTPLVPGRWLALGTNESGYLIWDADRDAVVLCDGRVRVSAPRQEIGYELLGLSCEGFLDGVFCPSLGRGDQATQDLRLILERLDTLS